jgi:hypothetical protein
MRSEIKRNEAVGHREFRKLLYTSGWGISVNRPFPAIPPSFCLYDLSIGERCRHERSDDLASGKDGGGGQDGSLSRVSLPSLSPPPVPEKRN